LHRCYFFIFCYYSSCRPCPLHSFPTRRSSDLFDWRPRRALGCVLVAGAYSLADEFHQTFVPGRTPSLADCGIDTTGAALGALVRSEEHTSELQSLAYLVCRLLLEKKNISPVYK